MVRRAAVRSRRRARGVRLRVDAAGGAHREALAESRARSPLMAVTEPLDRWIAREYAYAAKAMLASVSAVGLEKQRPGFGQTIRAKRGSIVASPVLASWDPEPDYFFHWF